MHISNMALLHIRVALLCLACLAGLLLAPSIQATSGGTGKNGLSGDGIYLQPDPACIGEVVNIPVRIARTNHLGMQTGWRLAGINSK